MSRTFDHGLRSQVGVRDRKLGIVVPSWGSWSQVGNRGPKLEIVTPGLGRGRKLEIVIPGRDRESCPVITHEGLRNQTGLTAIWSCPT